MVRRAEFEAEVEASSGEVAAPSEEVPAIAVRTDPFAAGERVGDKYVIERVIGTGGVGVVVAARHIDLDELVAIKFLHAETQKNRDIVRRFKREARAAVRIKSEYAVRVFDVGTQVGRGPYFVMEYLEGIDLSKMLEQQGPLPVKRAIEHLLQTCEALAVAHAAGIVHRDIKPENLFVATGSNATGVVKVLDFGISKMALAGASPGEVDLHETQTLVGTPLYMSPEQVRANGNIDPRTDIWSLGVVLYELLTGKVPFTGDSINRVCAQILESTPVPMSAYRENIPDELQAVVNRCLAKDPSRRFQNVAELAVAMLPFGPTFARVSVERTATILRASGQHTGVSVKFHSAPPPAYEGTSSIPGPPPVPALLSDTAPSIPADTVQALTREARRSTQLALFAVLGALALVAILVGVVLVGRSGARAEESPSAAAALQPPQPQAVPAAEATAAAPAGSVTMSISATPSNARIYVDDVAMPSNPHTGSHARDGRLHVVRVEAKGHVTRTAALSFDSDKELVIALDSEGQAPAAHPAPPARGAPGARPQAPAAAAGAPPAPVAPAASAPAPPPPAPAAAPKANHDDTELPKGKKPTRGLDTQDMWGR